MTLKGWNPLVLLPVAFFAAFIILAFRAVRRSRKRKFGA
jgi:hypothetical protein